MKKDVLRLLTAFLPGKDAALGLRLIEQKRFEDLKDIVDSHIKKLEKIEDDTGEIQKCLVKLYRLSEGLEDYVFIFNDSEFEEI